MSAAIDLLRELRTARPLLLYGEAWIARIDAVLAASSGLSEDWARVIANPTIPYSDAQLSFLTQTTGIRVCVDPTMPDGTALFVWNGKVVGAILDDAAPLETSEADAVARPAKGGA